MVNIILTKEKTAEEMIAEKSGFIPVGIGIMSGVIGNGEVFSVMLSGSDLYFQFENGVRRVSGNLDPLITEAFLLSRE